MKLKKFFAGVLAAAMMLTVGATAAFATEGNKVDASYEGMAGEYNAKRCLCRLMARLKLI